MIIDTNVYSALDAGSASAKEVVRSQDNIKMPIIVVAELKYGFSYGDREALNIERLNRFLALESVSPLTPGLETAGIYAELATYCRRKGRVVSHNDLWIASLAKQYNEILVTYDRDFCVFEDVLRENLVVLDN